MTPSLKMSMPRLSAMAKIEEKRVPTLADGFIYNRTLPKRSILGEKQIKSLQARARQAHRFVFDNEASERVACVVRDIPDLVVRESQFARAPFDLTWIEYQADPYWMTVNAGKYLHNYEDRDRRVAYLIDHNRVNVVSEALQIGHCDVFPIAYHLNTEWEVSDQIAFAETMRISRLDIDKWFFGATANMFREAGDDESLRALRASNMAELLVRPEWASEVMVSPTENERTTRGRAMMSGSSGDLRTIIAFLLMLNRPSIVRYDRSFRNSRGWVRNRPQPFLAHTTVKVSLDAAQTLKLIGTPRGDSVPRRRHEVRGHYCHSKSARDYARIAGCVHQWRATLGPEDEWAPWTEGLPGEANHWVCAECGGKRWWRIASERGDASKGFVVKDGYAVAEH